MNKPGIYYYILPTYKQAKQVIWDGLIHEHVPKQIVKKMNESELAIYYTNGSIQRFVGCEDIDKHRGINPIDVVFDEYAEMDELIWTTIIQPVLRENSGRATFIFTPKGRNHAWRLIEYAKQNPEEWFYSIKNVYDTKSHSSEEIIESKKSMPEALFNQEFLCSFIDDATSFFRGIDYCTFEGNIINQPDHVYTLGVDLAKYQDWTVLTPFDATTMQSGLQLRFNQIDWNLQKARIQAMSYKFNNAKIKIDKTGVGDPVCEDLQNEGVNIEPFTFTEQSRMDLLNHLALLIEQQTIRFAKDPELITELQGFQYKLGKNGKIKIESVAPHDDRVMSLALAVYKIFEPQRGMRTSRPVTMNDLHAAI